MSDCGIAAGDEEGSVLASGEAMPRGFFGGLVLSVSASSRL
jgi:hypothetical protein